MSNYTIGDTPLLRDIAQSRYSDFLWVLPFIDVATDGTETETDLTWCDFEMKILELDGATAKQTLTVGAGITVVDNVVSASMALADFADWTKGCKYPYRFTFINADDFTKCLFEGKFIIS